MANFKQFSFTFNFKLCNFQVDYAFGPEHSNTDIYNAAIVPLVDLGLRGGISTLFAYGQTGSGKTFTVSGVLEPLAYDLFNRDRFLKTPTATNANVIVDENVPQNDNQSNIHDGVVPENIETKIELHYLYTAYQ